MLKVFKILKIRYAYCVSNNIPYSYMAFYKVIFNPLYINNFYPLLGRANFTLFKFFLSAG